MNKGRRSRVGRLFAQICEGASELGYDLVHYRAEQTRINSTLRANGIDPQQHPARIGRILCNPRLGGFGSRNIPADEAQAELKRLISTLVGDDAEGITWKIQAEGSSLISAISRAIESNPDGGRVTMDDQPTTLVVMIAQPPKQG